jgi:oligopeptide transport system substrate-binding protein
MKPGFLLAAYLLAFSPLPGPAGPSTAEQRLVFNLSVEPKSLDPHRANGVPEAHVILNLVEGLTRTDEKGDAVPAIAESWKISTDGRSYTFQLRPSQWSNGEPVTAGDFVFAWRRCLQPEIASEYAYHLFFLEGAEDFNAGRTTDPATIGVEAATTATLKVRLRAPTPFFLSALAHYAYAPLNQSWVDTHPEWASKPSEYLCNGPFTLSAWRHSDRIVMKRNPRYYDASKVRLETLEMAMVRNDSTALLEWDAGRIDLTNSVPLPDIPRLKSEGKYNSAPYLGTYYVNFNHSRKPFNDARVRHAFALAINRDQITQSILRGGQKPALAFIPPGIENHGADFREAGGNLFREDATEAQRLLAEAGYPKGRGFPRVKYLYNDMENHRVIAQALQHMWQSTLGVHVDLEVQEWKVFLQNRRQLNYQMSRAGWIGDYFDPVTFLDIFLSRSGNNDIGYSNPEFDALMEECKATTEPEKRIARMRDAERQLIARDMVVAPMYFYVREYLCKPYVKGVQMNALGYIYFRGAHIEGR